ncbi:TonB-dependent receptor [Pontibacter qinzhouensis]|uniref:TonB-dependent receptor n=1 Tax=Pontibacter qinzhouensis TaxID=2603253 RepID=A0A5C8JAW9_9BACT|nr:TonB-dependent receptor [Pontibacter qinzhouensis]TXK33864.1 TonB-dependent receptor [Pontibacter qinzhouensis]
MLKTTVLLLFFLFLQAPLLLAQDALLQKQVELQKAEGSVEEMLQELGQQSGITFSYSNSIGPDRQVKLQRTKQSVQAHLAALFQGQPVAYVVRENKIILYAVAAGKTTQAAAQKVTISGYVTDAASGEALIGATIQELSSKKGVTSNQYGFYSLTLPAGEAMVAVSYIGYQTRLLPLQLHHTDTTLALTLTPSSSNVQEVTVTAQTGQQLAPTGMTSIPIQRLKNVPTILGEPDVMKALALTPGVAIGNEGTTGLLVRGGSQDQNLILLDEATVYNAAHLFGFVSIFNPDALNKVDMYKGGFPARFGGRLSSVLDMTMKEGNNQEMKSEASIGLISSRFNIEGPIGSENTSFMFSGRASYLSLFMLPAYLNYHAQNRPSYYNYWLYDVNAKVNHRFKDGSRLFLSVYNGNDFWKTKERYSSDETTFNLGWGNTTATARYSRVLNPKLFFRSVLTNSQYRYGLNADNTTFEDDASTVTSSFETKSTVHDWTWRNGIDYYLSPNHQLKFGVESTHHTFRTSALAVETDTLHGANRPIAAWEHGVYLEDEAQPFTWLKLNAGLRGSAFQVEGRTYKSLEPRFSVNFLLPHEFAVKGAYSQMRQYIHLLTTSGIGLPNDIWVPATRSVAPQFAQQVSAGISKNLPKLRTELSVEAYHKTMTNLIDYRQGYNLLYSAFNSNWQDEIETGGHGEAYGLEFFANRTEGRFTGWLAYTLAWSNRRFSSINDNQWYPANFDRRHVISFTGNYKISSAWSFSGNWMFMSGQPATLPVAVQEDLKGNKTFIYTGRNNARMPAYHRLDVGAAYTLQTKRGRSATWNFGVYNAYNRINPFYLDFKNNYDTSSSNWEMIGRRLVMRSLFPLIPSVNYTLRFN